MSEFKKLDVWRKGHELAVDVDKAAARLRGHKRAFLRSQLTRAASSIVSNIVEGNSESTAREYARYVRYSISSTSELEYHLIFARDTGALPAKLVEALLERLAEVRKMLYGLRSYLLRLDRKSVV